MSCFVSRYVDVVLSCDRLSGPFQLNVHAQASLSANGRSSPSTTSKPRYVTRCPPCGHFDTSIRLICESFGLSVIHSATVRCAIGIFVVPPVLPAALSPILCATPARSCMLVAPLPNISAPCRHLTDIRELTRQISESIRSRILRPPAPEPFCTGPPSHVRPPTCILVGPPALSRILVAPAALTRIKVYTPASLRIFVDRATNTRETVGNMHERAVCALTSVWQGGWVQ